MINANVLITRSFAQAGECVNVFSSYGLFPYVLPMIDTSPLAPPSFAYNAYDLCILTSPSAVRHFDLYRGTVQIRQYVAIGSATAQEITAQYGISYHDILIPSSFYFDEIKKLLGDMSLCGKKILAPGAKTRIQDVQSLSGITDIHLEAPAIYETVPVIYDKDMVNCFIKKYSIQVITFFSPSAVHAYMSQAGSVDGVCMVSVGATTQDALQSYGLRSFIPPEQNAASMAEFITTLI